MATRASELDHQVPLQPVPGRDGGQQRTEARIPWLTLPNPIRIPRMETPGAAPHLTQALEKEPASQNKASLG